MTTEELLTRALAAEAEARQVDVAALHREVLDQLPSRSRNRRSVLLAVAAAGVLATGTVATLALWDSGEEATLYGDAASGAVDTEFSCPVVNEIDFRTTEDDGFIPDLMGGARPADVARDAGAATFEFVTAGETATLRLGNEDGVLGSITTYDSRGGDGWKMRTARVCAGVGDLPLAPTAESMRLGDHGAEPWPPRAFYSDKGLPAGFVDDRPYYNLAGVIEGHRSMYVRPCEADGWCWVSGEPDNYLIANRARPSAEVGRPHDISGLLVDPDLMVGRENPYAVWAYDVSGEGSFSATLEDGTVVQAKEVTHPEWDGRRVLVVLVVRAEARTVQFTDASGTVTTWRPDEIPQ